MSMTSVLAPICMALGSHDSHTVRSHFCAELDAHRHLAGLRSGIRAPTFAFSYPPPPPMSCEHQSTTSIQSEHVDKTRVFAGHGGGGGGGGSTALAYSPRGVGVLTRRQGLGGDPRLSRAAVRSCSPGRAGAGTWSLRYPHRAERSVSSSPWGPPVGRGRGCRLAGTAAGAGRQDVP